MISYNPVAYIMAISVRIYTQQQLQRHVARSFLSDGTATKVILMKTSACNFTGNVLEGRTKRGEGKDKLFVSVHSPYAA
jgi:hypothetical protein